MEINNHRFDRLPHDLAALLRRAPGVAGHVLRVPRSLRGLADRGRDLIERGRCLFEARSLLFGAMGEAYDAVAISLELERTPSAASLTFLNAAASCATTELKSC